MRESPTVKLSIIHAAPRADRMETTSIAIETIFSPLTESGADRAVMLLLVVTYLVGKIYLGMCKWEIEMSLIIHPPCRVSKSSYTLYRHYVYATR
jgi:hypothetical protein